MASSNLLHSLSLCLVLPPILGLSQTERRVWLSFAFLLELSPLFPRHATISNQQFQLFCPPSDCRFVPVNLLFSTSLSNVLDSSCDLASRSFPSRPQGCCFLLLASDFSVQFQSHHFCDISLHRSVTDKYLDSSHQIVCVCVGTHYSSEFPLTPRLDLVCQYD